MTHYKVVAQSQSDAAKTTHAECVARAGATPRISGRLEAEQMGSLPPEVEVLAAFRFVLRIGACALVFWNFLLAGAEI